jgi:hypothetical protein
MDQLAYDLEFFMGHGLSIHISVRRSGNADCHLPTKVAVIQVLPVAARTITHHLRAQGDLSSSGCASHPGEKRAQS